MASDVERTAMRRAVALARHGLGATNPNPVVGAVVLDPAGRVAGEGWHRAIGAPHAEVEALAAAGPAARGGTLVVTLEPCRHLGRTGPCTEAILAAGVSRVVYAVADPNPDAAGGAAVLRDRGVDVEGGVEAGAAEADNARWLFAQRHCRPHLTWKYAATLDGRTAAADGSSRWITGRQARADAHRERLLADAVLVGIGTVLTDDPQLTVRHHPAPRQPLRVVLDGEARTPVTARVLDGAAPTAVVVGDAADDEPTALLAKHGADVVRVPRRDGRLDLVAVLSALREREVHRALLEGGATLAASFVRAGLIDRIVGYHAPALLGDGPGLLTDAGIGTLDAAVRWRLVQVGRCGDDIRIEAEAG